MIKRYRVLLSLMLVLLLASAASAQSEGIELEHSPNGKRALRLHEEKRAQLVSHYHESIEPHRERFEQTCERHLNRYAALLDREVRALTRKGMLEEAAAVQAAVKQVESLTISPPNSEGLHFLSKATLEVKDNEKATQYGVDLLVDVQSAAEAYTKQTARALKQYKANVNGARQHLQSELAQILEQEQRAGRLDAVQEVQTSIEALKKLPEVTQPEPEAQPDLEEEDPLQPGRPAYSSSEVEIPEVLQGIYSVRYAGDDRLSREAFVELRSDGAVIRGQYYNAEDRSVKWNQDQAAVKVSTGEENKMRWAFTDSAGEDIIVDLTVTQRHTRTYIDSRTTTFARGNGSGRFTEPARCYVRKMGYKPDSVKDFSDGLYTIEIDLQRTPEGEAIEGKMKFRLEVTSGTFLITERSSVNSPDKFKPCMPTVFRVRSQGADVIWEAEYCLGRQMEMFVLRTLKGDKKEIQLWWNRSNFHNGQTADAYGTLTKEKE
jgi:hypothetical protein